MMKKLCLLILAVVIVACASIFGTYAYFTSKAEVKSNLIIKTGNLKLEEVSGAVWEYKGVMETGTYSLHDASLVNQATPGETENFITIKPGDIFEKKVTIKNTGSLTEKITVTDLSSEIENEFVTFSIIDGLGAEAVLRPDETKVFTIKATVASGILNGDNNENQNMELNFEQIILEINGKQLNDLN